MRFTAVHFNKDKEIEFAILTDDYTEEEVKLGKHILNLKKDMKKMKLDSLQVFDQDNKLVSIVY